MLLLLKQAHLIDPVEGLDGVYDILISDGVIAEIDSNISNDGAEVISLQGHVVCPGFVDMHVHLREPGFEYKETIESGSRAAAHGGITAVASMANTNPVIDDGSLVRFIVEKAQKALCRVWPYGALSRGLKGKSLAELGEMADEGAVGFSDDGAGVQSSRLMRQAMEYARMLGIPVIAHSEDECLIGSGCVNEGVVSTRLGLPGSPALGETLAVMRDVELARLTGAHVHICHVSAAQSVEVIRQAKAQGVSVSAEVTPHHLLLTEDAIDERYQTSLKMNPPLRTEIDRLALVDGLCDGTIDAIASDHAPHAPHEKDCEFELASYGTVGLETMVPIVLDSLINTQRMTLSDMVMRMAYAPRRILSLPSVGLRVGSVADLTILDTKRPAEVTKDWLVGRSKNSAFIGHTFIGCATHTMVDGKWTMFDGEVVG